VLASSLTYLGGQTIELDILVRACLQLGESINFCGSARIEK
jgi:hypothetical protein